MTREAIQIAESNDKQANAMTMGVPLMLVVVFLSTCLAVSFSYLGDFFDHPVHSANYVMIFLTGVLFVSSFGSRKVALSSSLLSVLAYDFFFVDPRHSFIPSDRQYFIVVGFMFLVAIIVNELAFRARNFAHRAEVLASEARTEKLKNTLLHSVSHDLKSPLTAIMGAATLLEETCDKPLPKDLQKELAHSIAIESARLNRIVSNLLEMTRLETGGIKLKKDWYHLEELLANALASVETRYGELDIDIQLQEDMPLINVDPLLMEQLLVNSLENCVKYAPNSPYLVQSSKLSGNLLVSIENQGKPLDEETIDKLFEKFFRADTRVAGAGLGLSICHSIVELHGGKIWFEKNMKEGVRLNFEIPLPDRAPLVESEDEPEGDH